MSENDREYPWSRKGEAYDEMFSEGSFDEEEEFDPEEAERRIMQFVTSAEELSGPRIVASEVERVPSPMKRAPALLTVLAALFSHRIWRGRSLCALEALGVIVGGANMTTPVGRARGRPAATLPLCSTRRLLAWGRSFQPTVTT